MTEHSMVTIITGVIVNIVILAETNMASGMSRDGAGRMHHQLEASRDSVTEYVTNWSFVTTCVT